MSVKYFLEIVKIKPGFQYEPKNLDVTNVCFYKVTSYPNTHEERRIRKKIKSY